MPAQKPRAMPKFTPASAALTARFQKVIAAVPGAETRRMFGYPAAFVNGQMFTGLFRDKMMLRLSSADRVEITAKYGAQPFEPIPGRPMREYVSVPEAILNSDAQLRAWLQRGLAYARSLPPKKAKAKKSRG